jgi:hypothetical protein
MKAQVNFIEFGKAQNGPTYFGKGCVAQARATAKYYFEASKGQVTYTQVVFEDENEHCIVAEFGENPRAEA